MDKKENEIKATDVVAWIKKDKNNNDYFSIKVTLPDGSFVQERIFANKKTNPAQPDYRMIKPKLTATPASPAPFGFDTDEPVPF